LVINTGTTISTFLMVFLIQQGQNKDSHAVHLKLDELLCALQDADNRLVDIEDLDEDEIDKIAERYQGLAEQARNLQETVKERKTRDRNAPEGT
jgi:low affinity Fe/Cu permease